MTEVKRKKGAPRKTDDEKSNNTVTAALKEGEKELLERAAEADDRSLSSFLRLALLERANRILGLAKGAAL